MPIESEQDIGILCRNGFMTEKYDEQFDDLIRTLTNKGMNEIKEILRVPEYRKIFAQIFKNETIGMTDEDKVGVVREIQKMLNESKGTTERGNKQ